MILINIEVCDYMMAKCKKTSEIMLSMDGHNCSIRKRFSDIDLQMKTKDIKNLLNLFLSVYYV